MRWRVTWAARMRSELPVVTMPAVGRGSIIRQAKQREGFMNRLRFLILGVTAAVAALLVALPVTAAPAQERSQRTMIVFVEGCDGLVAQGGVLPDPRYIPNPTGSQNHNFTLSSYREHYKTVGGIAGAGVSVVGYGFDAARRFFAVVATGMEGPGSDVWSGGSALVIRGDGSYVRGTATRLGYGPMSPPWTQDGLRITASTCRIR